MILLHIILISLVPEIEKKWRKEGGKYPTHQISLEAKIPLAAPSVSAQPDTRKKNEINK